MRVFVTDVSVFFDLFSLEVLPEFFGMDWEIHTTDFVYDEIHRVPQKEVFDVFVGNKQLGTTKYANATMKTLQLKILKTAAWVKEIKTKVIIELPKAFAFQAAQKQAFDFFYASG